MDEIFWSNLAFGYGYVIGDSFGRPALHSRYCEMFLFKILYWYSDLSDTII